MSPLDKSTRREFMVTTSSAALGAVVPLAGAQPDAPVSNPLSVPVSEEIPYSSEELFDNAPQRTFSGDSATQIAMPLGGIGAGCICLNGYGRCWASRNWTNCFRIGKKSICGCRAFS